MGLRELYLGSQVIHTLLIYMKQHSRKKAIEEINLTWPNETAKTLQSVLVYPAKPPWELVKKCYRFHPESTTFVSLGAGVREGIF